MLSRGAGDLGRLSSARVGLWRQQLSNSPPGGDNVCSDEEEECSVLMQMVVVWVFFWVGLVFSLLFRTNILSFTSFAVSKWEKDLSAGGVVEEMCSNCAREA